MTGTSGMALVMDITGTTVLWTLDSTGTNCLYMANLNTWKTQKPCKYVNGPAPQASMVCGRTIAMIHEIV